MCHNQHRGDKCDNVLSFLRIRDREGQSIADGRAERTRARARPPAADGTHERGSARRARLEVWLHRGPGAPPAPGMRRSNGTDIFLSCIFQHIYTCQWHFPKDCHLSSEF